MAHMKDFNLQMKVQAERIRLQSRGGWTPGSPDSRLKSQIPLDRNDKDRHHDIRQHVRQDKSTKQSTPSRPSSLTKDASSTPSKIPIRKPRMSALKEKTASGMSAMKRRPQSGIHQTSQKTDKTKHVKFSSMSTRPGNYTWHKGGRIQEIRIRYIARKFFQLWVSACFGKLGPHRIRAHYNKQLLRRAWREWHDMWWVNRREWRLNVRSQYHYRYCMTRKVWQAWVQYVVKQRISNAKVDIANVHANTKLLQISFTAWKQYIVYRNVKKKNFGNAYRIADTRRLAWAWQQWRAQMEYLHNRQDKQQYALQYWADGLVHKAWVRWRGRLSARIEMKRKEELAIETYHKSLLSRCFYQGLIPYVLHRRDIKQQKGVASQFYLDHLVHHYFQHWHTQWFICRSLALRGQQIDIMAQRARLRRVWIHWRYYVYLQGTKAAKIIQATRHYHRHLMKQGLNAFHTAVALNKLQDIRKQRADEMRCNLLLRRSWSLWLQRCEHKEELRLFVQSRRARNHYKHILLSQAVHGWLRYTRWRQHRRAQYTKADAHYVSCLLPKCLRRIQMFAQMMRDNRYGQQQAEQFRRECLLGFCFARWYHSYQTSLDVRMMQRMAVMHYDHNVALRMMKVWQQRTRVQLQDHAKDVIAVEHYQFCLIRGAIQTWKTFTADSLKRQDLEHQAARHHYHCVLRKGWIAWTKFVTHQRIKSRKQVKAEMYYRHRLLRHTLDAWKVYNTRMMEVHELVKKKEQKHNMVRLRWAFERWSENARILAEEVRNVALAEHHHGTCILKKVLICWRQYAVIHAHKQSQKIDRLLQIRKHLDKGKCQRAFQAWRSYKDEALLQHLAERRAVSHYQRRLIHKALDRWKTYRQLEIKKSLLQHQCVWLHNTRITAKYFLVWRAQHHAALAEHSKTTIALWQWSLVLQQRVLNAWMQYTLQQKHKKQRIAVAMEMRRQRLLREGVGQWLRVAMDMADRREKRAAQQHAQTAYRSYNIVRRCAHHWRQKTLANRHKRAERIQPQMPLRLPRQAQGHRLPGLPKPSSTAPSVAQRATHALKEQFDFRESTKIRPKPRRPEFLIESLQREGLWKSVSSAHRYSESNISAPADDVAKPRTPCSSDEDDAVDESLPRKMPPPPPSPQPKHLVESSVLSQMKERTCDSPDRDNLSTDLSSLDNDDLLERQGNDDERTKAMVSGPLLIPPSAFTVGKPSSHVRSSSLLSSNVPSHIPCTTNSGPVDSHRHLPQYVSTAPTQHTRTSPSSFLGLSTVSDKDNHSKPSDTSEPIKDISSSAPSGKPHLLSPDDFATKERCEENEEDILSETSSGAEIGDGVAEDEIYKEIQDLKNQLVQYQQAKQRLRSLKEQYRHLKSWLKELKDVQEKAEMQQRDDEDAATVRQEVTQMEEEIAELTSYLDHRKPLCAQILLKVNMLATQIH